MVSLFVCLFFLQVNPRRESVSGYYDYAYAYDYCYVSDCVPEYDADSASDYSSASDSASASDPACDCACACACCPLLSTLSRVPVPVLCPGYLSQVGPC